MGFFDFFKKKKPEATPPEVVTEVVPDVIPEPLPIHPKVEEVKGEVIEEVVPIQPKVEEVKSGVFEEVLTSQTKEEEVKNELIDKKLPVQPKVEEIISKPVAEIYPTKPTAPDLVIENTKAIQEGIKKTKEGFFSKIGKALIGKTTIDVSFLDDLEDALVAADVGVTTTVKIIDRLEKRVSRDKYLNTNELNRILREEITNLLAENNQDKIPGFNLPKDGDPYVIMVVGVNGVGKTTTIGKLAYQFKDRGNSVLLGAADTFRAAAVDQLIIWSQRVDVPIISRGMNADPASVAYDTVNSAKSKGMDVAIIDTAGRLHNKVGLMNELTKIKNSISKVIEGAPHEVLLVLDASTGQNAIEQAKQFTLATNVNAIALTKLDGTAKGGVVIAIADQFKIPIKYIGVGEQMKDLRLFDKEAFIESLFSDI